MGRLFNKIKKYNFYLILLITLIISYGQILGMYVWQDDNGLFFKLAHINEDAGYFGSGPFGVGPYKYTITPYIPIFKLFGYSTFPYFFLNIVLYFLATICVYKIFSKIIGKKGGQIAGFLFAAGYLASDGFIRLFSSPIFSLSIIFVALFLYMYWKYYKQKEIRWYFLAILFFFLAIEFARARTHYLIGVAILFELIFFPFRKPLKSIFKSLFRIMPFILIFYQYFVHDADQRSGQVKIFVASIAKGDFQQLYSLVSSWSNLIVPDWITDKLFLMKTRPLWIIVPLIIILLVIFLYKKNSRRKILTPFFISIIILWTLASRNIFKTDLLNLDAGELFTAFLGGALISLFFAGYFALKRYKNLYLLLLLWALLNVLAYSAYNPTVSYESVNRYLVHSFFPLVGMFGIFSINAQGRISKIMITGLIVVWGLGNMINSAVYQKKILTTRSNPARKFYTQLKSYIPSINKGDIFYFDVAAGMRSYFADAFSVASMPETTAMAWRYGVDRYDFYRVTEFDDLISTVQAKKIPLDNIHSFFYTGGELTDTTVSVRNLFAKGGTGIVLDKISTASGSSELIVDLTHQIQSFTPSELEITLNAKIPDVSKSSFPYSQNSKGDLNKIAKSVDLRKLAFNYKQFINNFYSKVSIQTSSNWQNRIAHNLIDNDPETVWQADRILWSKEKRSSLILDLKTTQEINRFVWINAFGNYTPIKYSIELSFDGITWKEAKSVYSLQRIDAKDPQIVEFEPQFARFVRMTIFQSLNNDSPGIAEVWVIPVNFRSLDLGETQRFLSNPFSYIPNAVSYRETLLGIGFKGNIKVAWQNDKEKGWVSSANSKINVIYDGVERAYKLIIPAGGTKIDKIKFFEMEIPGEIILRKINVKYPTLKELELKMITL